MARRSRAKWQKGGRVHSLVELAGFITSQHSQGKTDNEILFYMPFSRKPFGAPVPLNWTVLSNMSLRTIEGSIHHGSMRYVEPREVEHRDADSQQQRPVG